MEPTNACIITIMLMLVILCVLFTGILHQNNKVMRSADKRLAKANEMVLTMAHSADTLSESIQHLKDMMVHLEAVYTSRNDMLVKNRDEFREAYTALLTKYNEQQEKYETMMKDSYNTLKEMARRPNVVNNNNLGEESQ